MADDKEPWFVSARSEALAGLLLTSREDVKVRSERKTDDGVEFLVEVKKGEGPSMRMFAVQVKGTVSVDASQWTAAVQHLFRLAPKSIFMPACLFLVNVRDNRSFYSWVAEPVVEDNGAKLRFVQAPAFRALDRQAVDEIVGRVNAWYDVLPLQLMAKSG
jgi:hypothetical protein